MTGFAPTLTRLRSARTVAPKLTLVLLIAVMAAAAPATAARLLSGGDRAHYKQAFKAAAKGDWRRAHRIARRGKDPLPRKILTWRAMTERDARFDFAAVTRFIAANPDWPYPRTLRRNAERTIDETTRPVDILAFFAESEPRTADGMIALGEALIDTDRTEDGERWLRRAWREGRFSRRDESRFLRRYRKLFSKPDHWARLDMLLWNARYREARRMLRRVSRGHQALAVARLRLHRFRGGVDGAISRVPDALRNDPGLLYERLRWRRRKGRDQGALDILQAAPAELGRPDLWSRERMIVARRLLADGRITDAYRITRDHGVPPEKRAAFAEIEWLAGWIALRWMNEPEEALKSFERVHDVVRYPVSKARAAYWAGRAAHALGRTEKAKQWSRRAAAHGTTYHGQLALASDRQAPPAKAAPPPTQAELKRFNARELVRAVLMLDQLGYGRWIRPFIRRLGRLARAPSHKRLVARLAYGIRRDDLAVWVARDAQRDGVPLKKLGYPLVRMREGRPERALLLALARQESNFDRNAISPAGARGIMQLMPRTARDVARSLRVRYSRRRLTRDSAYNVRLGRAYLRRMLDRFDNSYLLAIGAYNAGPNAVRRWVRSYGDPRETGIDPIDWIEMIPYEETRTYVQRVLGNLQVYRTRLRPGQVATTLAHDLRR